MSNSIRLFIAAPIPVALKEYLQQQAARYSHEAIRHVPADNLHLTLYFIGNVPQGQLPDIQAICTHMAGRFAPFTLQLEAIEPGPKPRSPRLIWARFGGSEPFAQLSRGLTQALSPTPPLDRAPIPHITLARFRKDRPAPHGLEPLLPEQVYTLPVDEIAIWHSELASPHPRYTIWHRYPLTGNPPAGLSV
jgi:RNA 2',3'-cyclic 3'-phosphodiesterase